MLLPISQKSPQGCPGNSVNVCLVEHRSFPACVVHVPLISQVYPIDGTAQTICRAATGRHKLQVKLATSHIRSALTLGQPVPVMALYRQVSLGVVLTVTILKSLVFFFFFFCAPQLRLWGSPVWVEIFAYVTVFLTQPLR